MRRLNTLASLIAAVSVSLTLASASPAFADNKALYKHCRGDGGAIDYCCRIVGGTVSTSSGSCVNIPNLSVESGGTVKKPDIAPNQVPKQIEQKPQ
jgi:hypothetical protein